MNTRYKLVKVEVNHKCFACSKTINVGDIVEMHITTYDGNIDNLYICENCIEFLKNNCSKPINILNQFEKR